MNTDENEACAQIADALAEKAQRERQADAADADAFTFEDGAIAAALTIAKEIRARAQR